VIDVLVPLERGGKVGLFGVHTFSHLSASIVLSRKRASEGLYPAIEHPIRPEV
jgi:F0F1-type ATP synthase beta subunit